MVSLQCSGKIEEELSHVADYPYRMRSIHEGTIVSHSDLTEKKKPRSAQRKIIRSQSLSYYNIIFCAHCVILAAFAVHSFLLIQSLYFIS